MFKNSNELFPPNFAGIEWGRISAQICIFSATYDDTSLEIAESITSEPKKKILLERDKLSVELIKQFKVNVHKEDYKFSTLADLYKKLQIGQCIIFVNSKKSVENISNLLIENDFIISKIHGDLDSYERNKVLHEFRIGMSRVLITTDVLSRGIDIEQIGIVINYDLPKDSAQYLHRIGRSGRFGKIGVAINFVTNETRYLIRQMESEFKIRIEDMPEPSVINDYLCGSGGHLKLMKD